MAFLQSEPPREPFLHAPASVLWLIGALVLAHVARVAAPAALSDDLLTQYAFIPARYGASFGTSGLFGLMAPFVSYMFLHADFVHLGVNCVWLLAFGPIVARRYGTMLFLLFFAVCGVAGPRRTLPSTGVRRRASSGHLAQYRGSWRPASECILGRDRRWRAQWRRFSRRRSCFSPGFG